MSTDQGAIRFAEKILALLEEGQFTATYKYAVLLGLLDLCLEKADRHGEAPSAITTRQLAQKVTELYWPHTVPFGRRGGGEILRQITGHGSQAAIIRKIEEFRTDHAGVDASGSLVRLRQTADHAYRRMLDSVEETLIKWPLPRVQTMGNVEDPFIYDIRWGKDILSSEIKAYQNGEPGASLINQIYLKPRVGEYLLQLNGLLRPIIHRRWAQMVARLNDLEEARLERFLFGASRLSMEGFRPGLRDLQEDACFYCRRRLGEAGEVDHFIPWSRYPEDGLGNLVLAHGKCNQHKRDFLAAAPHVARWRRRLDMPELAALERDLRWEAAAEQMLGVARAIYLRLPEDAVLWVSGRQFEQANPKTLAQSLS